MFYIKPGANVSGLQYEMRRALIKAEELFNYYQSDCVVTSARDGEHSAGSYHYYGYAVDFRIWDVLDDQLDELVHRLKAHLGKDYDVVLHDTHLHVEYDYEKAIQNVQKKQQAQIQAVV